MQVWHLSIPNNNRLPLFLDERSRRRAVRRLARIANDRMAMFSLVDTHVHIAILGDRAQAGRVSQAVVQAYGTVPAVNIGPGHVKPITTRSYLRWIVTYFLEQVVHHKLAEHPALWSGSCFQDLIGARVLDRCRLRITDLLPRLHRPEICRVVGLPEVPSPANDRDLRAAGASRLVLAASAALAADPSLAGRTGPVVQGKCAVARIGREVGIDWSELGWALGISVRSVRRLARRKVSPKVLEAVRLQISLESAVRGAGRYRQQTQHAG